METIFILAATIVVFSLFLAVYFIKDRSASDSTQDSSCARCDCQRGQQPHDCSQRHLKQIEKEVQPCSTRR